MRYEFGEYLIRDAELEDAQRVYEMRKKVCSESNLVLSTAEEITLDGINSWIKSWKENAKRLFLVVEHNGEIVGQLWCWFLDNKVKISHVAEFGMEIVREHRNKGIGTKLCEIAVNWAKDNGAKRLQGETAEANWAVRKILEKFGFELEGTLRRYLRNGNTLENVVIYGKLF
ncbi:MAG: GNAT family N-acetyltransferase [Fervidobacterium sp.]